MRARSITMLKGFVTAFNPERTARRSRELRLGESLRHAGAAFLLALIITAILSVPAAFLGAQALAERLSAFEEFRLGGEFAAGQLTLLEHPRVAVDLGANATMTNEQLLFTRDGVLYKRHYFFGATLLPWSALDAQQVRPGTLVLLAFLLLPSFLFWTGILHAVLYALLIAAGAALALVAPRALGSRLPPRQALCVALLTAPVLVLELPLALFWPRAWTLAGAYLVLTVISAVLASERVFS